MEFGSADRTRDSEYTSELKDYNNQVQAYNRIRTKNITTAQETAEGLKEEVQTDANTNALKEAGQHANAVKAGLETANQARKLGKPIKATEDIVKAGADGARIAIKKGDIIGKETAQTLGKSAGKMATGIGIIGDIGSIGMDIAEDQANWGKMSTMDKISNIADIGGAGLDMLGTGLMTFGGPVGAMFGMGLKGIGDIAQIASGVEDTISGYDAVQDKQKDIDIQEKKQEEEEGPEKQEVKQGPSLASAGALAVGRQAQ